MAKSGISGAANGMASGLLLAGAVSLLALPSAVLAFSAGFGRQGNVATVAETLERIEASESSAELAQAVRLRSLAKGKLYLFTPAEMPSRPDRSITVAVRVDPQTAKAMSVRGPGNGDGDALRIAPTAFSLGVARGYRNFTQNLVPPADSHKPDMKTDMPDLSKFSIASGGSGEDSRFSPRIVIDEKKALGRAPRTFSGEGEDQVDVGGSLRVTRNLDVTAGVRYSQEQRDRLRPLTDGKQDSQAVYVGTQFRF